MPKSNPLPTGNYFFNRQAWVNLGPIGGTNFQKINTRIRFDIQSQGGFSVQAPAAKIEIFNLSQTTRDLIKNKGTFVQLFAGYYGNAIMGFYGNVCKAQDKRSGADVISELECVMMPGGGLQNTIVSVSGLSTNVQLMNAALSALQNVGIPINYVQPLPAKSYNKGRSYHGTAKNLIDTLCQEVGYVATLDPNGLVVTPKGVGKKGVIYYLSPQSGLIDIPSKDVYGPGVDAENDQVLNFYTVKSLLNFAIHPQDQVQIKSKYIKNGLFSVFKASHKGDSWQGQWETTLECSANG